MILRLYSLLLTLLQPLLRLRLARRGAREAGYLQAVDERFGRYASATGSTTASAAEGGPIWVHAVSLGETRAAAILIERLREALPGMRLLLTHGTATGRAEGARLLREGDAQAWLPWDTAGAVDRFLDHFRPRLGILMETEVWPQLTARCKARGLPLVLANARLSAKSLRQAERLSGLSLPAYRSLAAVWAQTEDDAERLRALGAPVQGVFGNLKFDATPDAVQLARGRAWAAAVRERPVVMFASSREGEEKLLLAEIAGPRAPSGPAGAAVQWLIVPRHPQRFDEVAALVAQSGLSVSRRSAWGESPEPADVWIGDSLGEMALYYGLSQVALLGGSFLPLGGQNLIEAAACGCPVVLGPSTFNFAEAAELALEAGAACRVADMPEAVRTGTALALDAPRRDVMARAGARFAAEHRGAARRTAQAVEALLGGR
jgi:3-deoxy-D-manno-octulosonic-acid transferase